MIDIVQSSLFDYSQLTNEQLVKIRELETESDAYVGTVQATIGMFLLRAKDILPHGMLIPYAYARYGISRITMWRYMQVAQGANYQELNHLNVSPAKHLESGIIDTQPIETGYEFKQDVYTPPDATSQPLHVPFDAASQLLQGTQVAKEAYEAAIIADIPPITTVLDIKEMRDAHVMQVMGSSESPEWYTPQEIVRLSIELLGEIDLDPCSNSHETPNIPAYTRYTKEDDGLAHEWQGRVYLNPPYGSEIPQWIEKLVKSFGHGVTEAIALLPARIDTLWFQPLYDFPMCNIRGRLQFENASNSAPFPSIVVYLGDRIDDFIRVFNHRGPIMRRVG